MCLRGTHCGRSAGEDQISRAQSRRKSGTRAASSDEELSAEEKSTSPRGRVHAIEGVRENEWRFCEPVWAGANGSGAGSGEAFATQQLVWLQAQQEHFAGASALRGGTITNTCTQNRSRLRTMAESFFTRLV